MLILVTSVTFCHSHHGLILDVFGCFAGVTMATAKVSATKAEDEETFPSCLLERLLSGNAITLINICIMYVMYNLVC